VLNSPVLVEKSRFINAPAEQVWSLLSSPQAWSLRIASFAFDIVPASEERLRLAIILRKTRPACLLYEVTEDVPGQVMSLRTLPAGRERLTLRAQPADTGTLATIAAASLATGSTVKGEVKAYWQVRLEAWLANLESVILGNHPWPDNAMDPALSAACRPSGPLLSPAQVTASTLIDAPQDRVWDALEAPGSHVLTNPDKFVGAGHVPGTPTGQVGEMQYVITRDDKGRLNAATIVVTELAGPHRAVTALVGSRRFETLYEVASTPNGTALTLTYRYAHDKGSPTDKGELTAVLQANLGRLKTMIENGSNDQPSPAESSEAP
jgi:hypothetical protein